MRKTVIGIFCSLLIGSGIRAGEGLEVPEALKGVKFEGLYYLAYQAGQKEDKSNNYNKFTINRAYFTLKKDVHRFITSRITMDATQDETGDLKVRLKYLYADLKFPQLGFITKPHAEVGLVHTPWLDFEEHVNYYRMQGTMFMERVGVFNSGDFGITVMGYFAGELDKEYQKTVNSKYPGRYGSFAFGAYNGGGYHASEKNQNKVFQERITLRPLPDIIPGLQISELFIVGKGNLSGTMDEINDWQTFAGMLSYEHRYVTVTGQFLTGKGRNKGDWSDETDYQGYSGFAEGKLGDHWRIIGRYDFFDPDTDGDDDGKSRIIAGIGYDFGKHNVLLLDYDFVDYEASGKENDSQFQATLQIHF